MLLFIMAFIAFSCTQGKYLSHITEMDRTVLLKVSQFKDDTLAYRIVFGIDTTFHSGTSGLNTDIISDVLFEVYPLEDTTTLLFKKSFNPKKFINDKNGVYISKKGIKFKRRLKGTLIY